MKNSKLRSEFKNKRCLVCNVLGAEACHVRTYAVTLQDMENNLMPLCRVHHTEQHKIGIATFCLKYPKVEAFIKTIGLEVQNVFGVNKIVKRDLS